VADKGTAATPTAKAQRPDTAVSNDTGSLALLPSLRNSRTSRRDVLLSAIGAWLTGFVAMADAAGKDQCFDAFLKLKDKVHRLRRRP